MECFKSEVITFRDGEVYVCVSLYPYCAAQDEKSNEAVNKVSNIVMEYLLDLEAQRLKAPWTIRARYVLSNWFPFLGYPSTCYRFYSVNIDQ